MRLRTVGIWLTTITVCTMGSAAVVAVPLWNTNSMCDFLPGNSVAYLLGIIFGFGGFLLSLVLSPVAVKSDKLSQEHRKLVVEREKQAQIDAFSLLRGAECPPTQARVELLRPARSGNRTAPEHLLRAVQTGGPEV